MGRNFWSHLFLFTLLAVQLHGCGKTRQSEGGQASDPTSKSLINVSEIISVEKAADGMMPNFTWRNSTGKEVSFSEFKGKVVLVNFWATWCAPCRKEIPDLIGIYHELQEKGFAVIGISLDRGGDALQVVSNFSQEMKMDYPILVDDGRLEAAIGNIRGLPTSYLLDRDGKIVQTYIGAKSKEIFMGESRKYLNH